MLELFPPTPDGPADPTEAGYSPQAPSDRQRLFLALPCLEALYGGAAGGGKSSALLMAALQYAHVPGYSAILFRRTYQDLSLPGALMDRAAEWLGRTDAHWNGQDKRWTFPSGATLVFGYMDSENDRFRYASAEFQFIGFDELTQFRERDYLFMFSRLRRANGIDVPLRFRGATNPGGIGHHWVRQRFIPADFLSAPQAGRMGRTWDVDGRAFVPSLKEDNPGLDQAQYAESLARLDAVTRAQLESGDWSDPGGGRIKKDWLRRYVHNDAETYGFAGRMVKMADCKRLLLVDPAGTSKEIAAERRTGNPSYSAFAVVDVAKNGKAPDLIVRHMTRQRMEVPDVVACAAGLFRQWRPAVVGCENTGVGLAAFQAIQRAVPGVRVLPLEPKAKGKLERATPLLLAFEQGRVWLPDATLGHAWIDALEAELLAWTGADGETADQIDALAYAPGIAATSFSWGDRSEHFMGFG